MSRQSSTGHVPVSPGFSARPRLHTLGGPGVWLGADPIPGTTSRRRLVAFLALLASHRLNGITRDKVLAYLWPESDTAHARNSLKQALFWLRRVLRNPRLIVATGDVLRLDPSLIQVDAWEFEAALDRGDYRAAISLYQGPYLDGFHVSGLAEFDQWSESERARLARRYVEALEVLAQQAEERGEAESAVVWWRRLAEADPLSTSRALGLMQAMLRAGDPTGALEHFHAHAALVRQELDCPPSKELMALADSVHGGSTLSVGQPRRWSGARRAISYPAPPGTAASPSTDADPAASVAHPRARWWTAGALGVLLLAAAGDFAGPPPRVPGAGPALPFTVLPFAVTGAPEFADLGLGLQDLVAARLDGVGRLQRVVPTGGRPRAPLRPEARLDPIAGATVARRASARLYAMGQLIADSGGLQATTTIYDRGNANAPVARAEARADLGSVFDLADALAAQLIAGMYVGPDQRLARIAATSTRSLPALKAYLEGQRQFRADSLPAAIDAFRRAVRADSTFSLAYYRLSLAADLDGQNDIALWAAQLAGRFSAGLSDHERELVEAYLVHRRGRVDEAERLYRRIVAEHPADPEGWRRLADLLYHSNPLRGRSITESREPLTRLLALTPDDSEALIYLGRIAALEGRKEEADSLVRLAVALTPDSLLLDQLAFRAFALGDQDDARATGELLSRAGVVRRAALAVAVYWGDLEGTEYVARRLAEQGTSCEVRSLGHRLLGQVRVARGRPRDALASLRDAESCGATASLKLRTEYAVLPFLPVDTTEVAALREELSHVAVPDMAVRAYAQGALALRMGDTVAAQRALAELTVPPSDRSAPRAEHLARSLAARLALVQGRPRVALARLESVLGEEGSEASATALADRFLRAELLGNLGREDEALGWYASIAQRSSDELVYLAPAELRQAEIYDRRGDRTRAVEHYRRLLEIWQSPEPELLPTVERAKTRLTELGKAVEDH